MHPVSEYENINNERSFNMLSELNEGYSRSRFPLAFFKEESMYIRGFSAPQEESRDFGIASIGFHQHSQGLLGNNSVNFFNLPKMPSPAAVKLNPDEEKQKMQEQLALLDKNKKKGLKFLAWVLNRLLRKRKFYSTDVIDQCVQYVIAKEGECANYQKQLQNVKRRIYDAINVMSAVGLIVRNKSSQMYIIDSNPLSANSIKPSFLLMRKEMVCQGEGKNEVAKKYGDEISEVQKRIMAKKKHLLEIRKKNQILKQIITRNVKRQIQISADRRQEQIIRFPFFIVTSEQYTLEIECKKSRQQIKAKYRTGDLMILSEYQSLDFLKLADRPMNVKNQLKPNFQQNMSPQKQIQSKKWAKREDKQERPEVRLMGAKKGDINKIKAE